MNATPKGLHGFFKLRHHFGIIFYLSSFIFHPSSFILDLFIPHPFELFCFD